VGHRPGPGRQRARLSVQLACVAALALGCAQAPKLPGEASAPPRATPAAPPTSTTAVATANQPEQASGYRAKPGWAFQRQAVAAAHPLAAEAGAQLLRQGGNAVDAAVAVQLVLTLVEPQSSGIGGGAFLLLWDGQRVSAWDGRETAPAAAGERLLLQPDGKPMPFLQAAVGGRAVGTPGVLRMLEALHRAHGRLPWARLFEPAVALAEQGFPLGERLHLQLTGDPALRRDPLAAALYYRPDGTPHPVATRLRNPALAAVLRRLAAEGADALHTGAVAADIVRRVQGHAGNPGALSLADLAGYQALERAPICTDWLDRYRVCGMPPPSSGHLTVMQILGLLERLPAPMAACCGTAMAGGGGARPAPPAPGAAPVRPLPAGVPAPDRPAADAPSAEWLHAYTEAARLAYADRALHIADPAFVPAPAGRWTSLLDEAYLRSRAALITPRHRGPATAGQPQAVVAPGRPALAFAPQPEQPEYGTSHVSIVDAEGRAVALTTSVEAQFGARLMSDGGTGLPGGFLLNNQLTDFSFLPADAQGRPIANRVQPGKRPRSSMSPTLVFDRRDGRLLMTLGSPGGPAIIHFTAKALLGTLAWGLDAQQALDVANFGSFGGPTLLEQGRFSPATVEALKARGHTVQTPELPSGLQAIQRTPTGWFGGADPRREGVVLGD